MRSDLSFSCHRLNSPLLIQLPSVILFFVLDTKIIYKAEWKNRKKILNFAC